MSSVESTLQKQLTDLEADALARIAAAQDGGRAGVRPHRRAGAQGRSGPGQQGDGQASARRARGGRQAAQCGQASAGSRARGQAKPIRRRRVASQAGRGMGGPHDSGARHPARQPASGHPNPHGDRRLVPVARLHGARRPGSGNRIPQLRRAEYPAGPSRARHAGHVLAHRRQSAAHAHVAGAGSRHGTLGAAAAHDRAGPRVPQRKRGRVARAHLLSGRRHDDRPRCLRGAPDLFHEDAAQRNIPAGSDGAVAARAFFPSSSRDSSWIFIA